MFIVLPLSHERMEAQRLPVMTIGIIGLNVFFFLMTLVARPRSEEQWFAKETAVYLYYVQHPYLDLPPEVIAQMLPEHQQEIYYLQQDEVREALTAMADQSDFLAEAIERPEEVDDEAGREESRRTLRQIEQAEFNDLIRDLDHATNNLFYMKYGYIPARGNLFTMFSSMFLHGGWLHLIGNMLFLWLSGCNIEDLWGRAIYPVFYLIGGLFAAFLHGLMFPDSLIPLIGASGAIAAAMGAFMIRLYSTKIYFVYFIFLGLRPIRGSFRAPAYVMLPLWLIQQFWEVFTTGGESGVAVWAHIGGFAFGAVAALLMKVSHIEEKYITPALEKKTAVLDERTASGMTKLQEGDVDGALTELRAAAKNTPDDPVVHGELSRAYLKKGDQKSALRELKRTIFIYMKHNRMEEAVNEFLEVTNEQPALMLDPPQHLKMADAMVKYALDIRTRGEQDQENKERQQMIYHKAAFAYRQMITHYQTVAQSLESAEAVKALTGYGDVCLNHLAMPHDAYKAYQIALKSPQIPPEQKRELETKAQQAAARAKQPARPPSAPQIPSQTPSGVSAPPLPQSEQPPQTPPVVSAAPQPDIPIQKRIKIIQQTADAPAKYPVKSVAAVDANKIKPIPGGLDLNRPADPPLLFNQIYVICVSQVTKVIERVREVKKRGGGTEFNKSLERHPTLVADLFVAGRSRPIRLESTRIDYSRFFPTPLASHIDNFRQLVLYIIGQIPSVYLDPGTVTFLKTGKPQNFSTEDDLMLHEKIFWKQLMGAARFQCGHCWEVFWLDGNKIPEAGGRTTCAKCGHPLFVQKPPCE